MSSPPACSAIDLRVQPGLHSYQQRGPMRRPAANLGRQLQVVNRPEIYTRYVLSCATDRDGLRLQAPKPRIAQDLASVALLEIPETDSQNAEDCSPIPGTYNLCPRSGRCLWRAVTQLRRRCRTVDSAGAGPGRVRVRTAERPTHDGVDLGAGRGTPIRAAAAGAVTVVRCNIVPATHGCDVDGSPNVRGCG